jgi:cystathionine beta-lyase/cystathionine gamma-synthase
LFEFLYEQQNNYKLAVSLGSVDTLIEHPASMTHAAMPKDMREKMRITDGLILVSVGIEDVEDILTDFAQGLARTDIGAAGSSAFMIDNRHQ